MSVFHLARATRVVLALARPRPRPMREVVLDVPGGPGRALIYDPAGEARGAVVIIPGLALQAHEDARLHNLAKGFARGGYRGIVLEVPDLSALVIRPETDVDVADRLVALVEAGLVPHGRLGVLGPSFSGSLALRAAVTPQVADRVRAVMTVGAYAEATTTVAYLFDAEDADPYGRLLLLLNFLSVVEPVSDRQIAALRAAIADTGPAAEVPELEPALATLPPAEAERLRRLLEDPEQWRTIGRRILEVGGETLGALSVTPIVDRLRCTVVLLHGAHDNIVPPSESVELESALRRAGVDTHVIVSPVLDHANIQGGLTALREGVGMIRAFASFVRGLERDPQA
jgi:pimeloyl-ACP methyl ester carboxylesterase